MEPVFRLFIIVGIEVNVVDDDGVGCCEVDAQPPRLGGEKEDKDI